MNRIVISEAMGYIHEKYVLEAMELSYRDACPVDRDEESIIPLRQTKISRVGKIVLIAAAMAVILAVTAFAAAAIGGRVELAFMNVDDRMLSGPVTVTSEAGPIKLGSWYPSGIPMDYEITKSSLYTDDHTMVFENTEGDRVVFEYYKARHVGEGAASGEIEPGTILLGVEKQQWVRVGDEDGIFYTHTDGSRHLYWACEERSIGFKLFTTDTELDLIELALSVAEREELFVPTDRALAEEAIAQLGDYRPLALPEGYELYCTNGHPKNTDFGGDYAYVVRSYMDEEGYVLHLRIENDWNEANTAEEVRDFYTGAYADGILGDYTCSMFTIGECLAALVRNPDGTVCFLLWADGEHRLIFRLEADGLTEEELLAVAENVALAE